jgi:hypothetical protein
MLDTVELIVTSPQTRCIQTALLSFPTLAAGTTPNRKVPILAHESVRETVNYVCDQRRTVRELATEYPQVAREGEAARAGGLTLNPDTPPDPLNPALKIAR